MAKRSNTTSIPYAAKKKTFWQLLWKQKALCIMALAPLIMLIIFKYVPMYGILIAFKNYKASKGVWDSNWLEPVLKNFIKFFKNVNSGQIIAAVEKAGYGASLQQVKGKSAVQAVSPVDTAKKEYEAMRRRVIWSFVFTIPLFYLPYRRFPSSKQQ